MSDVPLLSYQIWIGLPQETRHKLVKLFNIPRTGEVVVRSMGIINGNIGSEVQSDGYTARDLYAISVPKMQELIGTDDTDFYAMFNFVIEHIDGLLNPPAPEVKEEVIVKTSNEPYAKKKKQK